MCSGLFFFSEGKIVCTEDSAVCTKGSVVGTEDSAVCAVDSFVFSEGSAVCTEREKKQPCCVHRGQKERCV